MIEKWGPVTDDFALVNAPVREAVAAYGAWMTRLNWRYAIREVSAGIDEAFEALAPLSASMNHKLFISAGPGWTAFFQNGLLGSDPTAGGCQLSKELDCVGVRVCATPDDDIYPAVMWQVWAPPRLGGNEWHYRRDVGAANDGGRWVFHESGDPYPFEERDRYKALRKRDRFTKDMLRHYLKASAVDPFAEGVLTVGVGSPAVLLETDERWATPPEKLSYAQAAAARKGRRK
jgi:hypothetical protein